MKTKVTELLQIEYPIIQGGMAWVAEHHLAAAVSEAGGFGLIGAASAPPEIVREEIRKAKELTDKPFGVNIMLLNPNADEVAKIVVEEGIQAVSVTCLAIIVGGVISTVHDDLVARGLMLFLWTFAVVFCHNTLGYLLGWLAGKCAGFNTAKKRTISIEVGMQNAGLATVLAGNFFAAQPLAVLPCAISCAWHSISGTILAGIYLKWDHMHGKD